MFAEIVGSEQSEIHLPGDNWHLFLHLHILAIFQIGDLFTFSGKGINRHILTPDHPKDSTAASSDSTPLI